MLLLDNISAGFYIITFPNFTCDARNCGFSLPNYFIFIYSVFHLGNIGQCKLISSYISFLYRQTCIRVYLFIYSKIQSKENLSHVLICLSKSAYTFNFFPKSTMSFNALLFSSPLFFSVAVSFICSY